MKRLKIALLIGVYCIYGNILGQEKSFVLNGTITGQAPEFIRLHYQEIIDTATVIDNKFQFKGSLKNEFEHIIFTTGSSSQMTFPGTYLENETIDMELDIRIETGTSYNTHEIGVSSIRGGKTAKIYADLSKFIEENLNKNNFSVLMEDKLMSLIAETPNHPVFLTFFDTFLQSQILNQDQVKSLMILLDVDSMPKYGFEKLRHKIDIERRLDVGKGMVDFQLVNYNNQLISTEQFRGKWLYIDFWASWCGPCLKEFPELRKIYKDFKKKNFEVLGVSLDKKPDAWRQAIATNKLIWENVIDPMEMEGEVATRYQIRGLPTGYLIDPYGDIVYVKFGTPIIEVRRILTRLLR